MTRIWLPTLAALTALAGNTFAQGTSIGTPSTNIGTASGSIGTTQGSTQEAGASGGNPTSEDAAASGSSSPPGSLRRDVPETGIRQNPSPVNTRGSNAACDALAGLEREKCLRGAGESGGTASGVGGSPDRVGPGSTGMGR